MGFLKNQRGDPWDFIENQRGDPWDFIKNQRGDPWDFLKTNGAFAIARSWLERGVASLLGVLSLVLLMKVHGDDYCRLY